MSKRVTDEGVLGSGVSVQLCSVHVWVNNSTGKDPREAPELHMVLDTDQKSKPSTSAPKSQGPCKLPRGEVCFEPYIVRKNIIHNSHAYGACDKKAKTGPRHGP